MPPINANMGPTYIFWLLPFLLLSPKLNNEDNLFCVVLALHFDSKHLKTAFSNRMTNVASQHS